MTTDDSLLLPLQKLGEERVSSFLCIRFVTFQVGSNTYHLPAHDQNLISG